MSFKSILFIATIVIFSNQIQAANYYVKAGYTGGNGSVNNPWGTISEALSNVNTYKWQMPYKTSSKLVEVNSKAPIKGGDTIYLAGGYYGHLDIRKMVNDKPITIAAIPGEAVFFSSISIYSSSNWSFDGLNICKDCYGNTTAKQLFLVKNHSWMGPSSDISISNSLITSTFDTSDWGDYEWQNEVASGVTSDAERTLVHNNRFHIIKMGISLKGDYSTATENRVSSFTNDGFRVIGDYIKVINNLVYDAYKVDQNHDDGIQSWSLSDDGKTGKGVVKGVTIKGNIVINTLTPIYDKPAKLQGLGFFDGFFDDWIVQDNYIAVNNWHGVSLYGVRNTLVENNKMYDYWIDATGPAQMRIYHHKDGTKSHSNTIINNYAYSFGLKGDYMSSGNIKNSQPEHDLKYIQELVSNNYTVKKINELLLSSGKEVLKAASEEEEKLAVDELVIIEGADEIGSKAEEVINDRVAIEIEAQVKESVSDEGSASESELIQISPESSTIIKRQTR